MWETRPARQLQILTETVGNPLEHKHINIPESSHVKNCLRLFQHVSTLLAAKGRKPSNRSKWTFWPNSSIIGAEKEESFNL